METKTVVKNVLRKLEGKPIRDKELKEIKEEVYKKTGQGKFANADTVKKWIAEAKKDMKEDDKKSKTKKNVKISEGARTIRNEIYGRNDEEASPEEKKTVAVQNINYELATVRQLLQRINKQLDTLEAQLRQIED